MSSAVAAAQAPADSTPATVDAGTDWAGLAFPTIKTVGALGLLASLVMVGFLVLRRLAPHYFARKPGEKVMRLLETLSMGDKRSLAVVEVAGQRFLVGNTPSQITLLAPLTDNLTPSDQRQEGAAAARPTGPTVAVKRNGFVNALLSEKNGIGRAKPQADRIPPDIRGKMRELREALET
jgi:flagellar biogenesis protein FliO